MHEASVVVRRIAVDHRADERMPEPKRGTALEQTGGRRRVDRLRGDPESCRRGPDQSRIADGLRRRQEQEALARIRQRYQPPPEALLDAPRNGDTVGQPEPA